MRKSTIQRNYELKEQILNPNSVHFDRIKILKKFIGRSKKVIDIGCGAFMPIVLKVDFACDINKEAYEFLKKDNWKGEFKVANITKLPYKSKEFEISIASEVIEHLKNKSQVTKAFKEIDRISKEWIVTTPSAYDRDPDHKFHFGYNINGKEDNLFELIPKEIDYIIIRKGYYFYISNAKDKLIKITGVKRKDGRRYNT